MKLRKLLKPVAAMFVVTLCLGVFFGCQAWAFPNEPEGYEGLSWGAGAGSVAGLVPFKVDQDVNEFYNWREDGLGWADKFRDQSWKPVINGEEVANFTRKNDTGAFGEAKLLDVVYSFWKGKFCGVTLLYKGRDNFYALLDELVERYGEGQLLKVPPDLSAGGRHQTDTLWEGQKTTILFRRNLIMFTKKYFGYVHIMETDFFKKMEPRRYEG